MKVTAVIRQFFLRLIRLAIIKPLLRAKGATAKRAILRTDPGEPDGVDIAQLVATDREGER